MRSGRAVNTLFTFLRWPECGQGTSQRPHSSGRGGTAAQAPPLPNPAPAPPGPRPGLGDAGPDPVRAPPGGVGDPKRGWSLRPLLPAHCPPSPSLLRLLPSCQRPHPARPLDSRIRESPPSSFPEASRYCFRTPDCFWSLPFQQLRSTDALVFLVVTCCQ